METASKEESVESVENSVRRRLVDLGLNPTDLGSDTLQELSDLELLDTYGSAFAADTKPLPPDVETIVKSLHKIFMTTLTTVSYVQDSKKILLIIINPLTN